MLAASCVRGFPRSKNPRRGFFRAWLLPTSPARQAADERSAAVPPKVAASSGSEKAAVPRGAVRPAGYAFWLAGGELGGNGLTGGVGVGVGEGVGAGTGTGAAAPPCAASRRASTSVQLISRSQAVT